MHTSPGVSHASDGVAPRIPNHIGPWRLVEPICSNERASVYRAAPRDCPVDNYADYVLKFIPPTSKPDPIAIQLIQREAWVAGQVAHENLLPVLSTHVDCPPFYIVTPFIQGATVREVIGRSQPIAVPHALWIARQTTAALQQLHAAGWTHSDVKPENIHISAQGHVTLLDLAFARRIGDTSTSLTTTLRYAAPEMLSTSFPSAEESDVYSLGVVLYEMITGRAPFPETTPSALLASKKGSEIPDPSRFVPMLSPHVSQLVQRMLARHPMRRPNCEELHRLLVANEVETLHERLPA